jgi:hypothetical protein
MTRAGRTTRKKSESEMRPESLHHHLAGLFLPDRMEYAGSGEGSQFGASGGHA